MQVHNIHQDSGFSMIEVLIALVILAVGILGVAGLQGSALRNTYSAQLRTQATSIAQDMVERIRTNRDFALANAENYRVDLGSAASEAATDCTTTICTETQLADFDRNRWLADVNSLPTGKGSVAIDPVSRVVTVTVMWDNDRTGASGTDCNSNDHTQNLTCFILAANP